MRNTLSPRDLARAIGVSESSLKRWADDGVIRATRTAGGHRRIARQEAIRFVRETNARVVRPQILGFLEAGPDGQAPTGSLFEALRQGRPDDVLRRVHGWFLAGRPLAWIFDGPVAGAMERIGKLWKHGPEGILREHQATDLCVQAIAELRLALQPPAADAPTAVGAAPIEDPYLLPGLMAAAVVQEAGMRPVNLGPETPLIVLETAADEQHAALAWLSVSTARGAEAAKAALPRTVEALSRLGTHLVVGGRFAGRLDSIRSPHVTLAASMAELAAFAKGLVAAR